MTLLERDASMESTIVDDEIQLDSGITRVLDDNNNTGAPVSRRFSSGPRRPRSRNVSYLRVRNKGSPVRDGKRWRGGWKKEDNEEEREKDISLPGRRRYGIPLDINRASCTKGGPLLSGHFIGAPGTI